MSQHSLLLYSSPGSDLFGRRKQQGHWLIWNWPRVQLPGLSFSAQVFAHKTGRRQVGIGMLRITRIHQGIALSSTILQIRTFLILLVAVSAAFVWLLIPFAGAIFWAIVLAILFIPMQRWLIGVMPNWPNAATLLTMLAAVVIVLMPVSFVAQSVITELIHLYQQVQDGDFRAGDAYEQLVNAVPPSMMPWFERLGLDDVETIKSYISRFASQAVRLVGNQAINVGQNTFMFVLELCIMLYLQFFLLRDGMKLSGLVTNALPLAMEHKARFMSKFATVVRATIKGNVVVAICQGALGGLIFWALGIASATLWGTVMAVLSLLPAVGAGLVWGPVAVYFLATGDIAKGAILGAYGVLVIGLVDNVLRPVLVGKDTRLPDYMVLLSTLGGLTMFGISGFIAGPLIAVLFLVAWDLFRVMNQEISETVEDR
ncbi:AI-2E family transporter [Orrella marina]|uniref:AI-2E family transporter n=1 Tax=Orrella marina TaxID=2163011 RepID=UPI001D131475|nr:AI-2E family transporter [Orrella marina]